MKVLITGACGYVGSSLTPYLLNKGHHISSFDTEWFGNDLPIHPNLRHQKKDIRDMDEADFEGIERVIHLANIANDPGVELNPTLSWEVNVLATHKLAELSKRSDVQQFIYASSGSVYGVKEEEHVTEELSLVPISVYNKTKMVSERVLLSYEKDMKIINVRPATVCGFSPRMRLDVSVNLLTFLALKNKEITVFGGDQVRPNIHMKDMISVYEHFLNNLEDIPSGNYNAGFENISILDIAKKVAEKINAEITISPSNDPRSYRQNSDKLLLTGFTQSYSVENAIDDVIKSYNNGDFIEEDRFYTVKTMKNINLDK
jgi:nucleoside-diphosphate-sugar epimerase|tara:strand:- start:307 stop:1254 length:948 start_codon:yes stop_codon:yes gene_type:complete